MKIDSILLVDQDPAAIETMARILAGLGDLRFASNGQDALRRMQEAPPDLLLLDAKLPGLSGFEVCEAVKADPLLCSVPVVFVTRHTDPDFEIIGFAVGAADFIAKPVRAPLMLARVKAQLRIKRMADELRRITAIDALTGVANRRSFDDVLDREWRRAMRIGGDPISLLVIDVDHFKRFNDRYGQATGDGCLRSVAQTLASICTRPGDVVARIGGEQFALLLPQTPRDGAEHMAHRALDAVEALSIAHDASPTARHVTVSIGVSSCDEASAGWLVPPGGVGGAPVRCLTRSAAQLLQASEVALGAAKRAGRAQALWLDIIHVDSPESACEVSPTHRSPRSRQPA